MLGSVGRWSACLQILGWNCPSALGSAVRKSWLCFVKETPLLLPWSHQRNGEGFSWEQDEGGCVCSLPASRAVGSTALSSSALAPSCCSRFQTFPRAADRTGTAWVPEISCGPGQSPLVCPGATGAQLGWRWDGRAGSAPPAALRVVGMMGLGHLVFT